MKELTLQELKEVEFEILKYFDAFCKENNIKYYLSHGTLLGAIRYKKFIPWDDDVDLLIPREDYDRMLNLFKDTERYKLFAFEKNKKYRYPFAKLCDMTTRKVENNANNGVELGIDIDIFPIDAWDDDLEKAKAEADYIQKNMYYLYLSKLKKPDAPNFIKDIAMRIVILYYKMLGSGHFIKKINKASANPEKEGTRYLGCKVWCVYGAKGIVPAEAFAETVDIEFEGEMFPAPVGYDTYLSCLYGDYLPEPPKEKQKTHHTFKAYKL
ncbi:MAG: LicD family protein [Clostridia bacterium]|nr:LicD family protein [Clostridia bacterium]